MSTTENQRLFKLLPWFDLDIFYAKVKFGHIGFCMGKVKTRYYLETVAAIGLKLFFKYSNKCVNEVK